MAPSSNYTLIALLVVALAGVILQPSVASRTGGRLAMAMAANADRAPVPSQDNGDLLPPQPRECRPLLERMMPCAGFLTNATVYAPEPTCCDGFNALFTMDTVTCLCHVVNGDIDRLLPAPMRHMRMVELFRVCGHDTNIPIDVLAQACKLMDGVPPIDLPSPSPSPVMPSPSPLPSPSPSPSPRRAGWP